MRNENVRAVMKTFPIRMKMREQRLKRYGHILSRPENLHISLTRDFKALEKRPTNPKKRRKGVIKRDLAEVDATANDALEKMRWRRITRSADPSIARDEILRKGRRRERRRRRKRRRPSP